MAILTSRVRRITTWVVSGMLAVLYLFAGGTKLAGMPMHVEHFAQWGYPDWFRLFVGMWEVGFGLLLLVPRVASYAAGALALAMLGAIYTELFRGGPTQAVVPLLLFGILVMLLWLRTGRSASPARPRQRIAH